MHHFGYSIEVQTSSTFLFSVTAEELVNVMFHSKGDLELGVGGVTYGNGIPMASGAMIGYNALDFQGLLPKDKKKVIYFYAVANGAVASMRVAGFTR